MNSENDNPNICTACIGDLTFSNWIRDNGRRGVCDCDAAHGDDNAVVSASEFAEEVDRYFRETYQHGGHDPYVSEHSDNVEYQQRGEFYTDILANDLRCDENVISAIEEHLPDASHRDIARGAEAFYQNDMLYESTAEAKARERAEQEEYWYENRFSIEWDEFAEQVKFHRRFFETKEMLDSLFGQEKEYQGPAVTPLHTLQPGQRIYRARILDDGFTEQMMRADPAGTLGAPPPSKARAGRMNVEFIPAFYGAFSEETAIAEKRPGVGEMLCVGVFTVQHPLKVFDFTAFARASLSGSRDHYNHTRYAFIQQIEHEISRPIFPYETQREYIPTQIVAEYLRAYFQCDAVIYRSAMMRTHNVESRNIVVLPGRDFAGSADAMLAFDSCSIKEVRNVTYEIEDPTFL